jgi:2-oxoisovalerate dehydrogenase E2 component (dihydrolipoyl transacylase)
VTDGNVFRLPDLGEGLTEAEIVAWHVGVGDEVRVDQVVVEVETAKASVEVPIPFAGRISTLHAEVGESVAVGAPLISATADDAASEASGNVLIGYGTKQPTQHRRRRRGRTAQPEPVAVTTDRVSGTGPSGLIMRRDVQQATRPATTDEQRIPLTGVRKLVADKLSRSRREIPEATVWVDVDATELLAARAQINARASEQPVSLLSLLARFTVAGLHRYPELNGRVEADEIVLPSSVHLGFAAQTGRGLVVPVVRDAHTLSVRRLAAEIARLTASARDGHIAPADLTGGTFTVNNYGVFGVDGSAAIINHPEVAILGIGRIIDRPWVIGGELTVRKISQLTLTFDHRVCDGGTAGGFLRFVADCVESPVSVLGDL